MAIWTFVKKSGAPSGPISLEVGGSGYLINDTDHTTIVVTDSVSAAALGKHPYLTVQGVSGVYVPGNVEQPSLFNGILSKPGPSGTVIPFDGSELPAKSGRFYLCETYNAKIDGQVTQDGTMTTGSHVLECASSPFASTAVGNDISVDGAGTGGTTLLSTIASFTDSGHVTLADQAVTDTSGAQVIWGTNDYDAWKAAYSAVGASYPIGGIIKVTKPGISLVNGPLDSNQGVLTIPPATFGGIFGIEGPTPIAQLIGGGNPGDNVLASSLIIFANGDSAQSSTTGTPTGSVITGGATDQLSAGGGWNNILFWGRDFVVRTPVSSGLHGLDCYWVQQMDIDGFGADIQAQDAQAMPMPQGGNYGLRTPGGGNGAYTKIGTAYCTGYQKGAMLNEHTVCEQISVSCCAENIAIGSGVHAVKLVKASSQWSPHHLTVATDDPQFDGWGNAWSPVEGLLDIEDWPESQTLTWPRTVDHINDTGNFLTGALNVSVYPNVLGEFYIDPIVVGATRLNVRNINKSSSLAGGASWNSSALPVTGDAKLNTINFDIVLNGNDGLTPGDALTLTSTGLLVNRPAFVAITLEGTFFCDPAADTCYIMLIPQYIIDFFGESLPDAILDYAVCGASGPSGAAQNSVIDTTTATPVTTSFFERITPEGCPAAVFPVACTVFVAQNSGASGTTLAEINAIQLVP